MSATLHLFLDYSLRLSDLPSLHAASERGKPVIPVFILDETAPDGEVLGAASRWWLHYSLKSLSDTLARVYGSSLTFMKGNPLTCLKKLVEDTKADHIMLTRGYAPHQVSVEKTIYDYFSDCNITVKRYGGHLMYEPDQIRTKQGKPYSIFSPFWKMCKNSPHPRAPLDAPKTLPLPEKWPKIGCKLESLGLLPAIRWDEGLEKTWTPGRKSAEKRLDDFLEKGVLSYHDERDRPDHDGTSALSPHLRFGEISAREIRYRVEQKFCQNTPPETEIKTGAEHYIRELGWREFSYHLLFNSPDIKRKPLKEQFAHFPWTKADETDDHTYLTAWQKGQTGYPLIDAGMRQLWQTGWMHNRVRMVVASFLVKELLWHWVDGEAWFWDTLVDADPASNASSWQWAAGCGSDAAPYFRIFNPILQGEKFDPSGDYVRKFVPELKEMPSTHIHKPWEMTESELKSYGVILGDTYPNPLVDRKKARKKALKALNESKYHMKAAK